MKDWSTSISVTDEQLIDQALESQEKMDVDTFVKVGLELQRRGYRLYKENYRLIIEKRGAVD